MLRSAPMVPAAHGSPEGCSLMIRSEGLGSASQCLPQFKNPSTVQGARHPLGHLASLRHGIRATLVQ